MAEIPSFILRCRRSRRCGDRPPRTPLDDSPPTLPPSLPEGRLDFAVLVSGTGSNLVALLDQAATPGFGGRIVAVISDRRCQALEHAKMAGVPAQIVPWEGDRSTFTTAICDTATDAGAEALVLAGFMRILGEEAVLRFPHRILNVHPSLLPAFPGQGAVQQALDYGVTITGVTVHMIDEQVDHGPIVLQRPVAVLSDDDVDRLHARIQHEEHVVFPLAVEALVNGRLVVDGRKVIWR